MNKLLKFGFTLAAGLVISACGSSGGGGDNNTSTTTPAANSTTTPSRTSTQPTVAVSSTVTGGAIVFGEGRARIAQIKDPSLTTLKVDGKHIAIISSNVSPNAWSHIPAGTGGQRICCGKYDHVRFGFYFDENPDALDYFFYNGSPTTAMPTSGRATYRGDAMIDLGDNYYSITKNIKESFPQGTSNFNVDFGAKTLTGSLNFDKLQAVNINANIANNSFKGSANSASLKGTARVEGKFYGENAKELGGFFENEALDDSFWNGVFGAIKQ